MQATASHVTTERLGASAVFTSDAFEDEPANIILPVLKQDARVSGRDHLLVRRRRRDRRISSR